MISAQSRKQDDGKRKSENFQDLMGDLFGGCFAERLALRDLSTAVEMTIWVNNCKPVRHFELAEKSL